MRKIHKYNYFYKITNILDGCYYYGVHSTDKLNDNYMGSGKRLHNAYKKHGINNFKKEILKFFDTIEECYEYEAQIVNSEIIHDPKCYNIIEGGIGVNTSNKVVVTNGDKTFLVDADDERFLNGELISIHLGKINVVDKNGKCFAIDKEKFDSEQHRFIKTGMHHVLVNGKMMIRNENDSDYDENTKLIHVMDESGNFIWCKPDDENYLNGTYVGKTKTLSPMKNKDGEVCLMSKDDGRFVSGEFVGIMKNKVIVSDKNGNKFSIDKDDPRYLNGEFKHINCGRKASNEIKEKMRNAHLGKTIGVENGMFGKHFYTKLENNELIRVVMSEEDFENKKHEGWIKGRFYKIEKFLKVLKT